MVRIIAVSIALLLALPASAPAQLCVDLCPGCRLKTTDALFVLRCAVGLCAATCAPTTSSTTTTSLVTTTMPTTTTTTGSTGFVCAVTVGVTSNETLGALQYTLDYSTVAGEFRGSGTSVQCATLVVGGFAPFFDDEEKRVISHAISTQDGFTGPTAVGECPFETEDPTVAPEDFAIQVIDASDPDFQPLAPEVAVTSVICTQD